MTESGPVRSITLPPSTAGTTRSRSVIAAKLSSRGFSVRERVVELNGHADLSWVGIRSYMLALRDRAWHAPVRPGQRDALRADGRGGAAAKAGHDLLLHVTAWEGTLTIGEDGAPAAAELTADATSLRVQQGTGGMKALDDGDKANIHQTIDDEVLKRRDIAYRSTRIDGSRVEGELTLGDKTRAARARPRGERRRRGQRQRDGHAVRLGHEALLRPLRDAEGPRRGRGLARGSPRAASRGRPFARRGRPRRRAGARRCRARTARRPRAS